MALLDLDRSLFGSKVHFLSTVGYIFFCLGRVVTSLVIAGLSPFPDRSAVHLLKHPVLARALLALPAFPLRFPQVSSQLQFNSLPFSVTLRH